MSNKDYGYDYKPLTSSRKRFNCRIFAVGLVVLLVVNFLVLLCLLPPPSVLDTYRPLNSLSPVHETVLPGVADASYVLDVPRPEERAVVTTLYSESFARAVLTLGRSLQNVGVTARRIVLYLPERLSHRTLCQLREVGWELRSIARIPPPNGGKGVHHRFLDQYSKLWLWALDEIGIKSVIYLDGDTLVRQNFDELWRLPFSFAAIPDVYGDSRGFTLNFNAGMMLLRTSSVVFTDMLSKIESARYRRRDAEQGFLNAYFASQAIRLPYAYNANIVIKQRNPEVWKSIEKDIRVVHYTMVKPFLDEERSKATGDLWETELEQWKAVWEDVSKDLQDKC